MSPSASTAFTVKTTEFTAVSCTQNTLYYKRYKCTFYTITFLKGHFLSKRKEKHYQSAMFYLADSERLNRLLQEVRSVVILIHNLHQDPVLTLRNKHHLYTTEDICYCTTGDLPVRQVTHLYNCCLTCMTGGPPVREVTYLYDIVLITGQLCYQHWSLNLRDKHTPESNIYCRLRSWYLTAGVVQVRLNYRWDVCKLQVCFWSISGVLHLR